MSYAIIDPILIPWVSKKGLKLFTSFKDEEVRSTEVVDQRGNRYQIWVEPADSSGQYPVYAWDYKKRKSQFIGPLKDLEHNLEKAYSEVQMWIASRP
jgi:hypothetical protein